MTLCPIAIAVGCKKCLVYSVCPVKGVIGDDKPDQAAPASKDDKPAAAAKKKP